ncbi:hypothetical protein PN498_15675 [Oscillatoria sp. CS-180]|uniref:hypothetical protein n=1 Tax=Oscillatoria sp. CS-180 TaxID=3021720 RepID=UPI00232D22F1|nr:hypothetical protein [Oscillatoria sp. CS-180]MDB9527438.1 hypothetical protein [Oscillatoria sp. CS-180]
MSLIFTLILIAIAYLVTAVIDGLPHLVGYLLPPTPLWLVAAVVVSIVAWLISEP